MQLKDILEGVYTVFASSTSSDVYSYIACEWVAPFVISFSFIWFISKTVYNFAKHGHEKGKEIGKNYAIQWFLILLICVPTTTIGGKPYNFLAIYPYLAVKTGIDLGNEIAGRLPVFDESKVKKYTQLNGEKKVSDSCKNFETDATNIKLSVDLSKSLSSLNEARNNNPLIQYPQDNILAIVYGSHSAIKTITDKIEGTTEWVSKCAEEKSAWSGGGIKDIIKKGLKVILYMVVLAIFLLPLFALIAAAAPALIAALPTSLAAFFSFIGSAMGGTTSAAIVMSYLSTIISHALSSFIFVIMLNLSFIGALITWFAKCLIYLVTFPFAALNLPFDRQRDNFFRLIVKGIALMFIPTIMVIIYDTSLVFFSFVTADGGLLDILHKAFISGVSSSSISSAFSEVIVNIIWFVFAPFVFVFPLAKLLYAAQAVVEELFQARAYYGVGNIATKIAQM